MDDPASVEFANSVGRRSHEPQCISGFSSDGGHSHHRLPEYPSAVDTVLAFVACAAAGDLRSAVPLSSSRHKLMLFPPRGGTIELPGAERVIERRPRHLYSAAERQRDPRFIAPLEAAASRGPFPVPRSRSNRHPRRPYLLPPPLRPPPPPCQPAMRASVFRRAQPWYAASRYHAEPAR